MRQRDRRRRWDRRNEAVGKKMNEIVGQKKRSNGTERTKLRGRWNEVVGQVEKIVGRLEQSSGTDGTRWWGR